MNLQAKPVAEIRHEAMRIAGKRVETTERVEVLNPYNGAVVGTVPAARPEHVREAFAKAHLPAQIEVYQGTLHGWCPPDSKVYDAAQAEKAWGRLTALLEEGLV